MFTCISCSSIGCMMIHYGSWDLGKRRGAYQKIPCVSNNNLKHGAIWYSISFLCCSLVGQRVSIAGNTTVHDSSGKPSLRNSSPNQIELSDSSRQRGWKLRMNRLFMAISFRLRFNKLIVNTELQQAELSPNSSFNKVQLTPAAGSTGISSGRSSAGPAARRA